jgi:hypothetical protein
MDRSLPELLQHICGFLGRDDLSHFSLVNKNCWAASRPHIFHTVSIPFSSPETLDASVERWNDVLASSGSFRYVQHLQASAASLYPLHTTAVGQRFQGTGDQPLDPWKYCAIDGRTTELLTDDKQWQKLVWLLEKFPALREMTWGCDEQIPSCILKHLHQNLPQCRLHMRNFCLRSLHQPPHIPIQISPHEVELITSPCLYSIAMKYDYMNTSGCADYNEEAILDMAAGLAPNLRKISLFWESSGSSPWYVAGLRVPRQQWRRDFIPPLAAGTAQHAALQFLELIASDSIEALKSWNRTIDFSLLQSLKVHYCLGSTDLRWLTSNCRFRSLHTLLVNPSLDAEETMDELADATESFILSLPPLRNLKITGEYQQRTVDVAINHSGEVLRKLHLPLFDDHLPSPPEPSSPGFANPDFLYTIQQRCLVIEDLSLCMLRSQGDHREVAIYRGLGSIPTLRKIHLAIYCSQSFLWDRNDWRGTMKRFDNSTTLSEQDKLDAMANALMDLAIDDTLARSIFRATSAAKLPYATPLERLNLRVNALDAQGNFSFSSSLIDLLQYVGRSLICTGTLRDDHPHECLLEEYDLEDKLDREEMEDKGELVDLIGVKFASALQRVWPNISRDNWKNEWHSFPLQA